MTRASSGRRRCCAGRPSVTDAASRSAVRRSARSARGSPSSSARRRALPGPRPQRAGAGDARPASPSSSPGPPQTPEQDRRSEAAAPPRSVRRMNIHSQHASSPSTTTTSRSPSTATRSASRSATTSPPTGLRWVTVGAPPSPTSTSSSPSRTPAARRPRRRPRRNCSPRASLHGVDLQHRRPRRHLREGPRRPAPRCCRSPSTSPGAPRDCAFRDPSGNMVRIDQPPDG